MNPAEVLLAGWQQVAPDGFVVHATWPKEHEFYEVRHALHDPLQLSETVRQTFPLLSHAAYNVPFGHQLVWQGHEWDLEPALLRFQGRAADLELHIRCSDVKYRGTRASAMTLSARVYREGVHLASARTHLTVRDPVVYARLRGIYSDVGWANARALPVRAPVPAYQVGRRRDEDVVLSPSSESSWQLRIDTSHRILFDHPVDHVPGMLLLEAARQAAQASVHRVTDAVTVTGMQTRFLRYTELDAPCWIKARPLSSGAAGARRVLVSAWQRDEEVFTAQVDLTAV